MPSPTVQSHSPPPTEDSGWRCYKCRYNLTGCDADRCPECGWLIDPELLRLDLQFAERAGQRRLTLILAYLIGIPCSIQLLGAISYVSSAPASMSVCLITAGVAGLLHLLIAAISVQRAPHWPFESPSLLNACLNCAALHIGTTLFAVSMLTLNGGGPFVLIERLITFGVFSIPAWSLLLVSLTAMQPR